MRDPHSVQNYDHFQLKSKQSQLNDHSFEQNEDRVTVSLKLMDFSNLQIYQDTKLFIFVDTKI